MSKISNTEKQLKEIQNKLEQLENSTRRKPIFSKFNSLVGISITALITTVIAYGTSITKSYDFSSGDTISSDQVNTNFDEIITKVNELDAEIINIKNGLGTTILKASLGIDQNPTYSDGDIEYDSISIGASNYNTSTNILTIPSTGVYKIIFSVNAACVTKSPCTYRYFVNGSSYSITSSEFAVANVLYASFTAADLIRFTIYGNGTLYAGSQTFVKVVKLN